MLPEPENFPDNPFGNRHDAEIDLAELLTLFWANRWLIAGISAAVFALAVTYAWLATPVYQVNALLQIEEQQSALAGLGDFSEILGGDIPAEAEIQVIRSRSILMQAVEARGLAISARPVGSPLLGCLLGCEQQTVAISQLTIPEDWYSDALRLQAIDAVSYRLDGPADNVLLEGRVGQIATSAQPAVTLLVIRMTAQPGATFKVLKQHPLQAYQALNNRLTVTEQGKQTGILAMTLTGAEPAAITDTLNIIANAYVQQNVERRAAEAAQSLAFIQRQLPDLKAELTAAETRLTQYQASAGSVDIPLETQSLLEQSANTEAMLSELEFKQAELSKQFTAAHPAMQILQEKRQELFATRKRIDAAIHDLPATEREAVRLMRDVTVTNQLYLLLLNKAQELKVIQAGTVGNARIIDKAIKPVEPISPRRLLISGLGLLGGIILGMFAVLLRNLLDRSVIDPDVLERLLGKPVHAVIPHNAELTTAEWDFRHGRRKERPLLALLNPAAASVESLRSLRTSLQFSLPGKGGKVVVLTGPAPGVGKSFLSANLAIILANAGKRTLLVDGDMRRGKLHEYFALPRDPGFSQILCQENTVEEACHKTSVECLDLISVGVRPPNPAELLERAALHDILQNWRQQYDYILIDTPPVLAVSDAKLLCHYADASFLVVRAGRSPARELQVTAKQLAQVGVQIKGLILNDFDLRHARQGAYGYAYRYEYE